MLSAWLTAGRKSVPHFHKQKKKKKGVDKLAWIVEKNLCCLGYQDSTEQTVRSIKERILEGDDSEPSLLLLVGQPSNS